MPNLRALAVLVLVASAAAAGCVSPKAAEGDDAVAPAGGAEERPRGGRAPADGGASSGAAPEGDLGHMPHMHDYWSDRERVTLFDGDVEPTPEDAFLWTVFYTFFTREVGKVGGTTFRLPEGAIVYEGTGRMEITATWEDPRTTNLAVAYQSPASLEYSPPQPLTSGATFAIDVTPEMTDMPHMSTSRWEFAFGAAESPGAVLGPFHLKIDIVRMRDVEEFPGHPKLFAGKPEKIVLDADGKSTQTSYVKRAPNVATQGEFGEHWITPTDIVPMETQAMRVEVWVTKAEASAGEVADIRLYYRTADSYQPTRAERVSGSMAEKHFVYELPVAMENTDSPYADESQWRFLVEAATSVAGEDRTCGGCVDTEIEFHVTVTAYDHAFDEDADADA